MRDPGCRGETPRSLGADPCHQVESWLHVEDGLAAQLGMRTTSATRPKSMPVTETDAQQTTNLPAADYLFRQLADNQ
jgi:hypothetical protein